MASGDEPARRVGIRRDGRHGEVPRNVGRHGAVRGGAETVEVPLDDLAPVEGERDRQPQAGVVERRPAGIEHDADREDLWIVEEGQVGNAKAWWVILIAKPRDLIWMLISSRSDRRRGRRFYDVLF